MKINGIKTRVFKEGESLLDFVLSYKSKIKEESVLVITSKIVSLSERRVVEIENLRTKDELIKRESDIAIPTKHVWLTIKDGMVMASAGIDESNSESGKLILLPKDCYKAASVIRRQLMKELKLKKFGVLITDSRTAPFRSGVIGSALGYAGIKGVRDYIGKKDIFGRKFKFVRTNVVDNLASAAILVMGEGNEQQPMVAIYDAPVEFVERIKRDEVRIEAKEDMYKPLFDHLNKSDK
jgi:dihydrofolate synthase / folylpolyglutamate synthase